MDISFPPVTIEFKVHVRSVADLEYLLECMKDIAAIADR